MKHPVEKVAVVGAGVMGAAIAAYLTNAEFSVFLLDIVPGELTPEEKRKELTLQSSEVRNRIVTQGLNNARRGRPPAFFLPELADHIRVGNLEDNIGWLADVDWIIEAVTENLEIKRSLLSRIDKICKPGTIVSSNTSGIPIEQLAHGLSENFRRHWLGTHFFNPPRYMKLLEIIPTPETLPWVIETIAKIGDWRLGKGIVYAKDTPNFIANRIGTFALQQVIQVMVEDGYTVDEVDQLTGPILGRPKSATFRTLDIVGLDTFVHVTKNIYQNAPHDEQRTLFRVPEFIEQMLQRNWLGDKSGQGFYKKVGKDEILSLNVSTLEYGPRTKVKYPSLEAIRTVENVGERVKTLIRSSDRVGSFVWKTLSAMLIYAANRIPEISDDIINVDNAMKWGFNWELGPFETWDTLGVEAISERIHKEGRQLPELVKKVLNTSFKSFYARENGKLSYFDLSLNRLSPVPLSSGILLLSSLKEQGKLIKKNAGASLIDLGDGVACVEFHSKMNSIGGDILQMLREGLKVTGENFEGLVIGNQGQNFSVGANLMLILLEAQEQHWDEIDAMVRTFQQINLAIKYAEKPVVIAPFGMTLGGGCEISLHCSRRQAAAETYMGLVELGVGLIPAGGGTKEMLLRSLERARMDAEEDSLPHLRQAFETIGMGKVSGSALEARFLGFLEESDGITMNRDHLIQDAKQTVLGLVRQGYRKRTPPNGVLALGNRALASLKIGIHLMKRGGYITEYDALLAGKLAYVLSAGDCNTVQTVSEQFVLDLEREAFLSLCGQRRTLERIQHMLQTGKPLRN